MEKKPTQIKLGETPRLWERLETIKPRFLFQKVRTHTHRVGELQERNSASVQELWANLIKLLGTDEKLKYSQNSFKTVDFDGFKK